LIPTHGSQMIYATALIILAIVVFPPLSRPRKSGEPRATSVAVRPGDGGNAPTYTCDPALTTLFTPLRPHLGRYEVCATDQPLDGDTEALEALDAFGAAGSYDRARLQRLFGGQRVLVQRSWTTRAHEFISTTRLSPHPDASLTHVLPGTLEIRWTLER
jgi:hypothetical protein